MDCFDRFSKLVFEIISSKKQIKEKINVLFPVLNDSETCQRKVTEIKKGWGTTEIR